MFKLSKKTEYALMALQHIASLDKGQVATAKEIAENKLIPHSLLAKILQQLTRHQLILSLQGAHGGYALGRKAEEITLAQMIEAIEGPIHIIECNESRYSCQRDDFCTLKNSLNPLQKQLTSYLHSVTLADVAAS
ncbi:MAG: Rrf2 family transcriptional regulator [Calditrichaeota bacterium]|nr:MAG: Rrf2 family transcriptional regulator [Calditrichota bacterium]